MVLLYLLGRRLVQPPFALLPLLMLFVEDQLPGVWETHPAWWASAGTGGGGLVRLPLPRSGRLRWWLAAGVCAALGAGFKQNLGIFTLAGLVGLALVEESSLPLLVPRSCSRGDCSAAAAAGGRAVALGARAGVPAAAWPGRRLDDARLPGRPAGGAVRRAAAGARVGAPGAAWLADWGTPVAAPRRLAATLVRLGLLGTIFVALTVVSPAPALAPRRGPGRPDEEQDTQLAAPGRSSPALTSAMRSRTVSPPRAGRRIRLSKTPRSPSRSSGVSRSSIASGSPVVSARPPTKSRRGSSSARPRARRRPWRRGGGAGCPELPGRRRTDGTARGLDERRIVGGHRGAREPALRNAHRVGRFERPHTYDVERRDKGRAFGQEPLEALVRHLGHERELALLDERHQGVEHPPRAASAGRRRSRRREREDRDRVRTRERPGHLRDPRLELAEVDAPRLGLGVRRLRTPAVRGRGVRAPPQ